MGKKGRGKKGKTRRNNEAAKTQEPDELKRAAHSFVASRGRLGRYVSQLVLNFRRVMEPFTASQLRTRNNTVRDLAAVAGPLGVTHLCLFTRSEIATYLKLAKFPRGPTLTFRVMDYTLSRDVLHSLKRMVTYSHQYRHGPLLILNNFSGADQHLQLTATMLQNMFPVLNIHKLKLNNLRRAVLFSYNAADGSIDFRHYTIKLVPAGLSRGVKKLVARAHVPNLARLDDMADFVMKAGYGSESEAEEDASSHVHLAQEVRSRGNMVNTQSAVRLIELGPRLTLQLVKAEAGLVNGEVLYHRLVTKTEDELEVIRRRRDQREQLKARRRAEQEKNVESKEARREAHKERSLAGMKLAMEAAAAPPGQDSDDDDEEDDGVEDEDEDDVEDEEAEPQDQDDEAEDGGSVGSEDGAASDGEDDDASWYRREVGQEPDNDFRAIAATGGPSRSVTKRFTKKRPAPRHSDARGAKRGRGEGRGDDDAALKPSERWKPRNKRGKLVSGMKIRRKETAVRGRGGKAGRGRGR